MRHVLRVCVALLSFVEPSLLAQSRTLAPPAAVEPIAALLDALRTHDIVAVTDPHGNEQVQALLLSLIREPGFAAVVNDIVIETASARYQDVIDRFVRGDEVPSDVLRKVWEEHTVPNTLGAQVPELLSVVRSVNAKLGPDHWLRVLAGDPPIDWENVVTRPDHRRWIEQRDSYPADVIRRQVLDRGRRALVVYGQGHLQRAQIASNYDMSTWQAQTLVSLLDHDARVRLFTVWTLLESGEAIPEDVESWHVPSLAILKGTTLGEKDFETYSRLLGGMRMRLRDGQLAPLQREEWTTMRMEDQFDALLYLGPPATFTRAAVPPSLCHDSEFIASRLRRLAQFAPPVEAETLKKACGL